MYFGYTCFLYDTYDTSNKVKFMLYEVSKTHVIQETQKLRHFFFKFYCQKTQCHRHAHMTHWSFLNLITCHLWDLAWKMPIFSHLAVKDWWWWNCKILFWESLEYDFMPFMTLARSIQICLQYIYAVLRSTPYTS